MLEQGHEEGFPPAKTAASEEKSRPLHHVRQAGPHRKRDRTRKMLAGPSNRDEESQGHLPRKPGGKGRPPPFPDPEEPKRVDIPPSTTPERRSAFSRF